MMTSNSVASHLLRARVGKICAAITGSTAEEMLQRATEVLKDTTLIEFRLDYLPQPAAAAARFKDFIAAHTEATVIGTCRCEDNGGRFKGNNAQALDVLMRAAEAGFQIVDIELESAEKLPVAAIEKLRATGAALIISHHNFKATKDLEAIHARIKPFAPEFIKIVATAQSLADNLTLMRFLERASDDSTSSIVALCMGEAGVISRVLGLRAGSAFTFAAAHAGEETAPGQIAARTLLETYRIDQVDAATKVYGVAGNPIKASLSPLMMNTAFRRETVNAVYLALQTAKADDLFKLVREIPIQGLSVTMPLKQSIMPMLERSDPLSTKIGAVNTVFRAQDGKFYGFNTDVAGIVTPLERRMPIAGLKILVIGAGGAGRAAVFGLKDKGAEVFILNRTPETAAKLAKQAGAKVIKREAVAKAGFDVIINSTPVGMAGTATAANKGLPLLLPEDLVCKLVFDLVYNPIDTPLIRLARQKGIAVITGIEMFVQQGARQFEIWTGKPAPQEEMMKVVLHALRATAESLLPAETAAPAAASSSPAKEPEEAPAPESSTAPAVAAKAAPSAARKTAAPSEPEAKKQTASAKAPTKQVAKKAPEAKPEPKPAAKPAKKAAAPPTKTAGKKPAAPSAQKSAGKPKPRR